ncbi:glycosyltransferase family 2 protein [Capnocytophaga sp. oral taxon 380]|jgi:glycoside transferase family 2|uniref:glycosyltransferase family 2 protein n=1 Tax=Capnocytophaga sp. oral taxon 380 TaxID=712217 RepID=UPI0002A3B615|nr:glycosyltransferase family 2 protein [Capnocytophaga sp. oral taxon 380]EKY09015.1 glycosyltransferase, group 2 family protein [Capnocytophaga sp. oral taxon 380 str. F0488]
MNNYKVTIITPIHKAERFIERCAKSLLNQDFESIEYIFINDATPDDSFKILKKLVDQCNRKGDIKLLENEYNLGVAKTRKKGMLEASGEYVIQIDSDDWIESNMISTLYNKAKQDNADIAVCDYYISFITGKETYRKEEYKPNIDFNIKNIMLGKVHPAFWNTLIKRSLYVEKNIFPEGKINMGEDYEMMLKLFLSTEKVSYIPKAFLYYTQYNENSITKTMNKEYINDTIHCIEVFEEILKPTRNRYIEEFRTMLVFWKKMFVLDKQYTKYFYLIHPEVNKFKYIFNNNGYGFFQKITISFMLLKMPFITRRIYKSYRWLKKKYKV